MCAECLDASFPSSTAAKETKILLCEIRRANDDLMARWARLSDVWEGIGYQRENGWGAADLAWDMAIVEAVAKLEVDEGAP